MERVPVTKKMSGHLQFSFILCLKYKQFLTVQQVKFILHSLILRLTTTLGWGAPQSEETCCGFHLVARMPQEKRGGGSDRPDSHSCSFPIHSHLKAVTRWLQNGIDYWFPSHHRSAVMAAVSGLPERQPVERWEAPAGNTQEPMRTHMRFFSAVWAHGKTKYIAATTKFLTDMR